MLSHLAVYDIELAEDPVASLEELVALRVAPACPWPPNHASERPPTHNVCINSRPPMRLFSNPSASVESAKHFARPRQSGVPAIASSALETSVGLAAVVALASSLPDAPFATAWGLRHCSNRMSSMIP